MINLKQKRLEKGLTQEQLGDKVGVGRTTISSYECGEIKPSVFIAKLIGKELDFEWFELFEDIKV